MHSDNENQIKSTTEKVKPQNVLITELNYSQTTISKSLHTEPEGTPPSTPTTCDYLFS